MDCDFLKLCLCIISLYKGKNTTKEVCEHLIKCLNFECLVRDNFEVILRILLREACDRKIELAEYLNNILKDKDLLPEIHDFIIKGDEL